MAIRIRERWNWKRGAAILLVGWISLRGALSVPPRNQRGQTIAEGPCRVLEVLDGASCRIQQTDSQGNSIQIEARLLGLNVKSPKRLPQQLTSEFRRLAAKSNLRVCLCRRQIDECGRTLILLYADDCFINAELVRNGLVSCELTSDDPARPVRLLLSAQAEAMQERRGIWEFHTAAVH